MKRIFHINLVLLLILFSLQLSAQEKMVIFVKPFAAKGVPEMMASNATELFKSQLSATNRVNLVSEQQWREVMNTMGIIMQNISAFDQSKDQEIGRMVKAEKLVTGSIEQFDEKFLISVNWIDLVKGLTERSISRKMENREQMQTTIRDIVTEIERIFVPGGDIVSITGEQVKIRIGGNIAQWREGIIFDLKKANGQIYGQVRIEKIDGDEALGTTFDLKDFVSRNDRVELPATVEEKITIKPNLGLVSFECDLEPKLKNDLYLKCQTQLLKSNRFNLFDSRTVLDVLSGQSNVKLDYIIEGEIIADTQINVFTVTLRTRNFATDQIEQQDMEKCRRSDLEKAVELLLFNSIGHFPLKGVVTKVDPAEITVGLGTDHNLSAKFPLVFKDNQGKTVIAEAKIHKIYRDHFTVKQDAKFAKVQLGNLVEMKEDQKREKKYQSERQKIVSRYQQHYEASLKTSDQAEKEKAKLQTAEEKQKAAEQRKIAARLAPKSRLKLGLGSTRFDNEQTRIDFGGKNTFKFNANLYVGNHPNFNLFFQYLYGYYNNRTHPNSEASSFIQEQGFGTGARVQILLPFLFSTQLMPYVEGSTRYSLFESKLKPGARIALLDDKWKGFYGAVDAGLEWVFNQKFSFFAQAGINRKIKLSAGNLKFEYLFLDGGMVIWF